MACSAKFACSPRPPCRPAGEVSRADYFDDTLYLISHRQAPRSKVLALDLRAGTMATAREVLGQSERVITGLGSASDALYVEARAGNVKELLRLPYRDASLQTIRLPIQGAFTLSPDEGGSATDPRLPGAVIELQGWTQARQIYEVRPDGSVANTGLQPKGPYDTLPDVVTTEVQVPGHDGQLVPMSIIHRRDMPLDGNRPTLLQGYAAYGNTEEPYYSVFRMAWLQAGGVHAIANPRGSGVYGEQWYKDGHRATKPNSWKDFIACAEYLVAKGYTRPARLGILGGSAGGILVGRAMTERPDLFAAVVSSVGALDMVRAEDTPNGVPNIPEFGSKRTEPGFRALLAMSTYHQIRDGTAYPAVMLTHGVNDPRVEVWHSTKTAARLMAATSSDRPILLRLDFDAGHGIGSTKQQDEQERADMIVFLLWQLGEPGYAPTP
ncbi:MAG TPA: prolyl oligopeptidase family serine peptidase [Burkholderiaceae bacterium]|nr:prolyl oligopeptidase family serine peptidase [Burkholderiaceae bacterium]